MTRRDRIWTGSTFIVIALACMILVGQLYSTKAAIYFTIIAAAAFIGGWLL